MSLRFYMDVHVPRDVSTGLARRGIDVLTAQEDGAGRYADPKLLDRATELDRILVSQDQDFLREAAMRQRAGDQFAGIVFAVQQTMKPGKFIRDLETVATVLTPDDMRNQVIYLPLAGD